MRNYIKASIVKQKKKLKSVTFAEESPFPEVSDITKDVSTRS